MHEMAIDGNNIIATVERHSCCNAEKYKSLVVINVQAVKSKYMEHN